MLLPRLVLATLAALLLWRAGETLLAAVAVASFPLHLDYGEGIVLQQALLITTPRAYSDITAYPHIVFHYPPVYHLLVRALMALGGDLAMAARGLSIGATLATCCAVAWLAAAGLRGQVPAGARRYGAAMAGLSVLAIPSVAIWMPLARVDMVAIAFSFAGLCLALRAAGSPARILLAALCCTLAVYTKQTSLAAPAASALLLLAIRPRDALLFIGSCTGIGLALLGIASFATDGGFLRHILLYNINRFELARLLRMLLEPLRTALFLLLSAVGLAVAWRAAFPAAGLAALRRRLADSNAARAVFLVATHAAIGVAMLPLAGKLGSAPNYFIELLAAGSVLLGFAFGHAAAALLGAGPGALSPRAAAGMVLGAVVQVAILPSSHWHRHFAAGPTARAVAETLIARVAAAPRPVLSDDMLLLLRAGREVPWEPAIFAELAATGAWDEALILRRIRNGDFAFAIFQGRAANAIFAQHYSPGAAAALDAAFPRTEQAGWLTLRLPAE